MKKHISSLLILTLFFLPILRGINIYHGVDFNSVGTGQHVYFDVSGDPWSFDSISLNVNYLEIDNGADSETFQANCTGGEAKFTIDVWDPDNTIGDAIIASWSTTNIDATSVVYEITGLEISTIYAIYDGGSYSATETTDASGVLTWTGHNLDVSHSIDIKYGVLGVSTATETFAIGYLEKGTESVSHSCTIENTGNVTENILIKFSTFTDVSSNTWTCGASADADQCVIKWSIDDINWNTIAAYDTYVTVKSSLAASDTFTLYIRITAPTSSTSYTEYTSTETIGCEQA